MTMSSYLGQFDLQGQQEKQPSNALVVSLAIAVSLFLLSLVSWFLFKPLNQPLYVFIPLAALFVAIFGILMIRRKRVVLGISLSLLGLAISYIFLITQFDGIGTLAAIIFTVVVISAVKETFPLTYVSRLAIMAIVLGLLLLMLDLFWPGARRQAVPRDLSLFVLLAIAAGLVVVVYSLRRYPHFSLREKLVAAFVAVALLPLITIVTLSNNSTQDILISNANERLQAAGRQTAVAVDDYLDNYLRTIRTEASLLEDIGYLDIPEEEREGSDKEASTLAQLGTYRDKDPLNISSYALLDVDGRTLLEYPTNSPEMEETERNYLTVPLETGQAYVSGVEFSPETGGAFIYFSAPVTGGTDQIKGIIRARVKASILQQLIARSTGLVGGQSFAVLFDENYLHLAHGTAPETLFKLVAPLSQERMAELQDQMRLPNLPFNELSTNLPELAEKLGNAQDQPFFTAEDVATGDKINQVAVTQTSRQPWLVAFFQPQEVFLAPIKSQTQTAIILSVVVTAAVVLVAAVLASFLTGPISRLQGVAEKVAQGDLSVRAKVESDDEIGSLANTFNLTTGRLQETLMTLEQRVADRTRALTISSEVGRRLSTILDEQQLVAEVVEQVQKAFGYYHAHIYLLNEEADRLIMVGGTGRPGQLMLEQAHYVEKEKGLVGRAARENKVVFVPDVRKDPEWLPNPLLPDTMSEVAVPIAVGDQVLGVLDAQDDETNGLQQQDADLLFSIANQVAIALQNAKSYAEIQRQAERRALINEINRKIQNTFDAEKAMQIAVREVGRAVGGRSTRVWLNDPTGGANGNSSDVAE